MVERIGAISRNVVALIASSAPSRVDLEGQAVSAAVVSGTTGRNLNASLSDRAPRGS